MRKGWDTWAEISKVMDIKLQIAILKFRFKIAYSEYIDRLDSFSCGATLAEYISPELKVMKTELKEIYDLLRPIDKDCPEISWLN